MSALFLPFDRARAFADVVVHPTQELPHPTLFRGGPDWPRFEAQLLARQCWGRIPRPVDLRPHPATAEWPYFDPARYLNPRFAPRRRWRPLAPAARTHPRPAGLDRADDGIWCGPVHEHFGVMIADYATRIAASGRLDPAMPLVFSLPPQPDAAPEPFFWRLLDHFGVDRRRVMLIRQPIRFARLAVCPQAERPHGGAPSRRYLQLLDELSAASPPSDPGHPAVFVSRSRLERGNFAGESYLDAVIEAAGLRVFHPQTVDLDAQLHLYRRAPRLVFSEGSALHALQLLGHVDAEIVVLTRRPGNRLAEASLRPRARSLRYLDATRGVVHGLNRLGEESQAKGISVIDERRLLAGLRRIGIDLAPFWDPGAYAARRDADIAAWVAGRLAAPAHPGERATVERSLAALSLRHLCA
ncbi:MAG TPA: glycosyltransferase family 61 protein [Stellaceae bacterium]|nr:glycosyltransferase family 61 protein [Stellaceae bacterium]